MSVLLYDPAEKRHVLLLLKDGPRAGKRWSVDLRVCDNPCCGCLHVDFLCVPASDTQVPSVNFVLDTQERSIYRPPGRRLSAISDSLAEAVVRELGESGWKYLHEFLLGVKQEQIENCDPKRLDADFPLEVLRGDTTVVGYAEIFPLSPALRFKIDSQQWVAIDDYCVNPDCDCRHGCWVKVLCNDPTDHRLVGRRISLAWISTGNLSPKPHDWMARYKQQLPLLGVSAPRIINKDGCHLTPQVL